MDFVFAAMDCDRKGGHTVFMKNQCIFRISLFLLLASCQPKVPASPMSPTGEITSTSTSTGAIPQIAKPIGCFTASGVTASDAMGQPLCRGALIRSSWASVEPSPGVYNFTALNTLAGAAKSSGKKWSLAILGGPSSPSWLVSNLGANYVTFSFRGVPGFILPLYWDTVVQDRLKKLATALGSQFGSDTGLSLVYITQMTANGVEGHIQGVDMNIFNAAGYTDDKWVAAVKECAGSYATAFPGKPVAVEVHEVNGGSAVPQRILQDLWNDQSLGQRVGAAVWWLSGNESYQANLLTVLRSYNGDVYCQMIAESSNTSQFPLGYSAAFTQARSFHSRYIELWQYEYTNHSYDTAVADFATWADASFSNH